MGEDEVPQEGVVLTCLMTELYLFHFLMGNIPVLSKKRMLFGGYGGYWRAARFI